MHDNTDAAPGLTVREVARRFRVSPDKVRAWIKQGELQAINTASTRCGKPRFVVLPLDLAEFERRKRVVASARPAVKLRVRRELVDYFPEE